MKRLISVILLICMLTTCFAACDSNNNANSSTIKNDTPSAPTCDSTGKHTYEQGSCTGCGLKVYDILKNYIKSNGELNGQFYSIPLGSRDTHMAFGFIRYNINNYITIEYYYQSLIGYGTDSIIALTFSPYTFEDGGYEWEASSKGVKTRISGRLDPSKFSESTSSLEHTPSTSESSRVEREALLTLKEGLRNDTLPKFLRNVGYNLNIRALGFTRF